MKSALKPALLALSILAWSSSARAQAPQVLFDSCHWSWPKLRDQWQQRQCWCPDDYCGKALPCVPPNARGCMDDYCGKALPCVPPNAKGCVDDYCPKKCPLFLGKLCEPWYTCGRGRECAAATCQTHTSKP
jgi:hypothetical protein